MSNAEKAENFFPRQKKHMQVKPGGTGPLKEGVVRMIRLGLKMGLNDGKLVGIPSYIADAYNTLAKADSLLNDAVIEVELTGMECSFYATEKAEDYSVRVENCMLSKFRIAREAARREGEAPPIFLSFSLRTNGWVPQLWTWLGDNFGSEFWMGFNSAQMSLVFVNRPEEDESDEESLNNSPLAPEVAEAISPQMDSVFGKPVPTPAARPKSAARRKAEEALSGKGPTLVH